MTEDRSGAELDRESLARRLHNGPLQSFFAALLLVETEAASETIEAVLTEGADQLRSLINEVRPDDD